MGWLPRRWPRPRWTIGQLMGMVAGFAFLAWLASVAPREHQAGWTLQAPFVFAMVLAAVFMKQGPRKDRTILGIATLDLICMLLKQSF
jgi:hypothetical protein